MKKEINTPFNPAGLLAIVTLVCVPIFLTQNGFARQAFPELYTTINLILKALVDENLSNTGMGALYAVFVLCFPTVFILAFSSLLNLDKTLWSWPVVTTNTVISVCLIFVYKDTELGILIVYMSTGWIIGSFIIMFRFFRLL